MGILLHVVVLLEHTFHLHGQEVVVLDAAHTGVLLLLQAEEVEQILGVLLCLLRGIRTVCHSHRHIGVHLVKSLIEWENSLG